MDSANDFFQKVLTEIVNPMVGLMIVLALVFFLYGMIEFISGADNQDKRESGKRHIVWGIIGLFITISVFGLMRIADIFGGLQ